MKILTKHSGFTLEHDNKYLTYLIDDNGESLSCVESIGEKARVTAEHNLMGKHEISDVETHDIKQFIRDNNLSLTHDGNPLILVFYLDRELMGNAEIIQPFSESINDTLAMKDANAMAFFIPTDDTERIECINPRVTDSSTQIKINALIEDITKNFEIGVNENDIEIKNEEPKVE